MAGGPSPACPRPLSGNFTSAMSIPSAPTPFVVDAEIISLTNDTLKALGFEKFIIRINSRKVLAGLIEMAGLAGGMEDSICRSLDKLEKIGREGVEKELSEKGIEAGSIKTLRDVLTVAGNAAGDYKESFGKTRASPRA